MATISKKVDDSGIVRMADDHGRYLGQKTPWKRWVEAQELPISTGVTLYDMYTTPVADWGDTGVKAAMFNFETGQVSDAWLIEIPPGGQTKPMHHIFDKAIFVVSGRGATSVWPVGGTKKQTFEWQRGSVFAVPLNAWHEFYNGSGSEPVRLFCVTTAPEVMNLAPNHDFVFNNPAVFPHIYNQEEDYWSSDGKALPGRIWQSNFIADVRTFPMELWRARGAGGVNRFFSMKSTQWSVHISEFPTGTFKKAHRHGPGAHLITLSGEGYTLEWNYGKELVEFPWKDGTCYTALNSFWHQHFNTGPEPVRYLAFTHGIYHIGLRARPASHRDANVSQHGDEMDYEEQEPWIMDKFEKECAKRGVKVDRDKMTKNYELSLPPDTYREEET